MAAQRVKISEIKPNPNNPRLIKDDRFSKLVKSIKDFPKMLELRPIVVNDDMIVLGGNMRLKACKEAGLTEVPVIKASDLTPEQQREFIIKDNLGYGEWDWELIANEWDAEQLTDWGLEIPDFKIEAEATEDDYEMPDEIQTDIVLGDLFEIGQHRLLCGDSTKDEDVDVLMGGQLADAVFTDPPYALFGNSTGVEGIVDDKMVRPFFKSVMKQIKRITKPYGHVYMCCDWHSAFTIEAMARETELKAKNLCIWDKGDGGVGAMYQQCYEMVWFFDNSPTNKTTMRTVKAGVKTVNGKPNIWRYKRVTKKREHNAQKPVEMVAFALSNSTEKSQISVDLFGGSGTTMAASHQIGCYAYLMEMEPKWCQVIVDRMRKLDPTLEIKRNGKIYEATTKNA